MKPRQPVMRNGRVAVQAAAATRAAHDSPAGIWDRQLVDVGQGCGTFGRVRACYAKGAKLSESVTTDAPRLRVPRPRTEPERAPSKLESLLGESVFQSLNRAPLRSLLP